MKLTLVILNLVAAVLVFPAMRLVDNAQRIMAGTMYRELDNNRVIDHAQLEEAFPIEAANDRIRIPERYFAPRGCAWMLGYPCIFGFVANAVLIAIFMKRKRRQNQQVQPIAGKPDSG